jgi:hypothetical protein
MPLLSSEGDRKGNCHLGLVAENEVTGAMKNDFYLQSHAAVQVQSSTLLIICLADLLMDLAPRSAHYTVLHDDIFNGNMKGNNAFSIRRVDVFSEFKYLLSHFATLMQKLLIPSQSLPLFIVSLGLILALNFNLMISLIVSRCRREFSLLVYHDSFSCLQPFCSRSVFHMIPESQAFSSTILLPEPVVDLHSTWTSGAAPSKALTSFWKPGCISYNKA